MAETKVPALKKVPTSDGAKNGSSYSTITTPNDKEGKVWSSGTNTEKLFTKK